MALRRTAELVEGWINFARYLEADAWFRADPSRMFRAFVCGQLTYVPALAPASAAAPPEARPLTLACFCLLDGRRGHRNGTLGTWLRTYANCAELHAAAYSPLAFVQQPEAASTLAALVEPLATVPFTLALYFEDVDGSGADAGAPAERTRSNSAASSTTSGAGAGDDAAAAAPLASVRQTLSAHLAPAALGKQVQQARAESQRLLQAMVNPLKRLVPAEAAPEPTAAAPPGVPVGPRRPVVVQLVRVHAVQPLGLDLVLEEPQRVVAWPPPPLAGSADAHLPVLVVRSVAPRSPAAQSGAIAVRSRWQTCRIWRRRRR